MGVSLLLSKTSNGLFERLGFALLPRRLYLVSMD